MLIPNYWSETKRTLKKDGKQRTLHRFGWSEKSLQDAEAHAQKRLEDAIQQWNSGEAVVTRERKTPYGEDGLPIREEIIEKTEDYVITRNKYGAICLNVEDVCFIDIDSESYFTIFDRLGTLGNFIWFLIAFFLGAKVANLYFFFVLFSFLPATVMTWTKKKYLPKVERKVRETLQAVVLRNPNLILRLYQTPLGFRVLLMNDLYRANDEQVEKLFSGLNADKLYVHMCSLQQCFRARVSPKPWRIAIEQHIMPRGASVPFRAEKLKERKEWVKQYNQKSQHFASCRLMEQYGNGESHPKAIRVQKAHDELCRADSILPLA